MRPAIGIDAVAICVPSAYVELGELATARGIPAEKYLHGLGVKRMAIAGPDEDPVSLAVGAARRLFASSGRDAGDVGYCAVGTETAVDHSKPVASYLHGLLGLPQRCRVFEAKHACYGATAALLGAVEWIAAGSARGRSALVVASDIARYELGSPGEPTQGAGAVAMLVTERPRLLEIDVGEYGSYARDVHDFWRPLHRKEALVDGHFSVSCYLDALQGAYADWKERAAGAALERSLYHVPYPRMAYKAHRRRLAVDGIGEADADARFAVEVAPSLRFASDVGNIYTGSLYLSLASLLAGGDRPADGTRVGLFSYGSGCGAEFFTGRVAAGGAAFAAALELSAPLEGRTRLTVSAYESIRRADATADRRAAAGSEASAGRVAFAGIDGRERRVYLG